MGGNQHLLTGAVCFTKEPGSPYNFSERKMHLKRFTTDTLHPGASGNKDLASTEHLWGVFIV